MKRLIFVTALFSLGIAGSFAPPSQAATITVFHGLETETVDSAKVPAADPHIIRPISKAFPEKSPAPERQSSGNRDRQITFVAGNTLWIHNNRTGRLVGCFVGSSGIVGKSIIRCSVPRKFRR